MFITVTVNSIPCTSLVYVYASLVINFWAVGIHHSGVYSTGIFLPALFI